MELSRTMRAYELLTEKSGSGVIVLAKPTLVSISKIAQWIDQQKIPNPVELNDLHTTIVLSKTQKFPWKAKNYSPSKKASSSTYKLELFGKNKNVLVLCFDSNYFQKIHNDIREKFNLPWEFDSYTPHITLSRNIPVGFSITNIVLPEFPIYFDREEVNNYIELKDESAGVGTIQPSNTTIDVKPGEIQRQAKKLGWKISKEGLPPIIGGKS